MKRKQIFVGALLVVSSSFIAQQQPETEIEEVTIASKLPEKRSQTGKNVQLLTEKDLEKYKGQNLNDVLQQVAGIQITGNYNGNQEPKSPKIRGGKLANVLILIDGVPLKDVTGNDYNAMDLRLIALENIASIEILNGASSVLYGSNATVSVINIRTKQDAKKKIEGQISARAGSFSTFAQNVALRGNIDGFFYQINGFNEKAEGLSSAHGVDFEKDGYEKQNVGTTFGYKNQEFEFNMNGGWNHQLYDFDEAAFSDGFYRNDDMQYFIGQHARFQYDRGQIVLNSRLSQNERRTQNFVDESFQDSYEYRGKNLFVELFNQYKFKDWFQLTAGIQHESQNLGYQSVPFGSDSLEEVLNIDGTKLSSLDVFAQARLNYKKFFLDLGTRYVDHSKFGNQWVYSINPYYSTTSETWNYTVGYSFATAFIAPTLYQTYGSLPYVLPNFDLRPETNQSHEIDLRIGKNDQTLLFNASGFLREEDQIFAYQNNPDFTGNFINIDTNSVKGFELGFAYQPISKLRIGGNVSFVEKAEPQSRIRQPKQRVNSYLEWSPYKSTRLALSHQFVAKRTDRYFDINTFSVKEVELNAFNSFDLNINQKIGKKLEVFAHIGNFLDNDYQDVAGYTTKPRNYQFGFGYSF